MAMQSSSGQIPHSKDASRSRSKSRRPKNGIKKQPQRGLGVAQLEKLRLQEQSRQQHQHQHQQQQQHQHQQQSQQGLFTMPNIAFLPHRYHQAAPPVSRSVACTAAEFVPSDASRFSLTQQLQNAAAILAQTSPTGFSWHPKAVDSFAVTRAAGPPKLLDGVILNRQHEELLLRQRASYGDQHGGGAAPVLDQKPQVLCGRQEVKQQQLEFAAIGTPSIGNKPRELSSFQIYQNEQRSALETKVSDNKRQRVESWLGLNVASPGKYEEQSNASSYDAQAGPHFTTGLVRNALGSTCTEKPVTPPAWVDKKVSTPQGLSLNDSLTTSLVNNSWSTASSPRPIFACSRQQITTTTTRLSSSEPEIESSLLTLGLSFSRTSSESSPSNLQNDEDDLGSSNSFQAQRGTDDCSSGSLVQPCARWAEIRHKAGDALDLNLRLSL